jgi:hypothetical protein
VRQQTGFDLLTADTIEQLPEPTTEELQIYRTLREGVPA